MATSERRGANSCGRVGEPVLSVAYRQEDRLIGPDPSNVILPSGRQNSIPSTVNAPPASAPRVAAASAPDWLECSTEGQLKSSQSTDATQVEIKNDYAADIKLYWINFAGKRTLYRTLKKGQSYSQSTFVAHSWVMTTVDDQCLAIFVVTGSNQTAAITTAH